MKVSKVVFGGRSSTRSKCSVVESSEIFLQHSGSGTGNITRKNIPGKKSSRRGRNRKHAPYECVRVQSTRGSDLESVYLYTNWEGGDRRDPPEPPDDDGTFECIDDGWKEINCGNVSDVVVLNEKDEFVVAKISKGHTQSISKLDRFRWKSIRECLPKLLSSKPDITRGQKRGGVSSVYACFGFRKDPVSSGKIGQYAYKQNASPETRAEMDSDVNDLTINMENVGGCFLKRMPETHQFAALRKELSIPSVSGQGLSTQFRYGLRVNSPGRSPILTYLCRSLNEVSRAGIGPKSTSVMTTFSLICRCSRPTTVSTTTFCTISVFRGTESKFRSEREMY